MTAEEMRALKLHFQFIGTTWTEWEERQRRQNEPTEDVYPNKRAPVVIIENGQVDCGPDCPPQPSTAYRSVCAAHPDRGPVPDAIANFEVALECLERADYPDGEDAMLWGEYGFAPRLPRPAELPIGKLAAFTHVATIVRAPRHGKSTLMRERQPSCAG